MRYYSALICFLFLTHFSGSVCQAQQKADSLLPDYQVLFNQASTLIDSSKYKESVVLLKKAVKKKKDYWEAYNKMAFAKIKVKDYKGAEKDLEMAEKIAPINKNNEKLKGNNFYHNNKFKEAKEAFDTAVYINNEEKIDDAELFYYRAMLMFKGKNYKGALDACENALEFEPKYIDVYTLKGQVRFAMKDYNYAIKELSQAIKMMSIEKTDYEAYKMRAKSYFEAGNYKAAVSDWNVYIEATPNEEGALVARAAAKINCNQNSSAITDLDEAIKLNAGNPVSFCYRGVAKGGNKQYVEALKDLDHAIELKFDYAAAYVNRAAIRMASKDRRGACADLEKADSLGDAMAYKLIEQYCKR